jgi:hypothetical protein
MTIIFFDGPDGSKKTTIARSISTMLNIPYWERGVYLPHHHSHTEKDGSMDLHQDPTSIWYIVDELKTIELFKKLGQHVIVDRHPKISECVYRRFEGRKSTLEYDRTEPIDEFVVLCYDSMVEDKNQKIIIELYKQILTKFEVSYATLDTSNGEDALDKITEIIYQWIPRL